MKRVAHEFADWWSYLLSAPEPMALAGIAGGTVIVASAIMNGEHNDVFIVVGIALAVLGAVEVSLSRRFARHEETERRDKRDLVEEIRQAFERDKSEMKTELSRAQIAFDGLAASYATVTSEVRVLRATLSDGYAQLKQDIENIKAKRSV